MALSPLAAWFCYYLIHYKIRSDCKEGVLNWPPQNTSMCSLPKIDNLNIIQYVNFKNVISGRSLAPFHTSQGISHYYAGTTIFFRCDNGYTPSKLTLTCVISSDSSGNATWDTHFPTCVKNACQWNESDAVDFFYEDRLLPKFQRPLGFPEGTEIKYLDNYCPPGYQLTSGPTLRQCDSNGRWTGSSPECEQNGETKRAELIPKWFILALIILGVSLFLNIAGFSFSVIRKLKKNGSTALEAKSRLRVRYSVRTSNTSDSTGRVACYSQMMGEDIYDDIDEEKSPYELVDEILDESEKEPTTEIDVYEIVK